jgi:hypothetical protein
MSQLHTLFVLAQRDSPILSSSHHGSLQGNPARHRNTCTPVAPAAPSPTSPAEPAASKSILLAYVRRMYPPTEPESLQGERRKTEKYPWRQMLQCGGGEAGGFIPPTSGAILLVPQDRAMMTTIISVMVGIFRERREQRERGKEREEGGRGARGRCFGVEIDVPERGPMRVRLLRHRLPCSSPPINYIQFDL